MALPPQPPDTPRYFILKNIYIFSDKNFKILSKFYGPELGPISSAVIIRNIDKKNRMENIIGVHDVFVLIIIFIISLMFSLVI